MEDQNATEVKTSYNNQMQLNFQLPSICDLMEAKNRCAFCTWERHNERWVIDEKTHSYIVLIYVF